MTEVTLTSHGHTFIRSGTCQQCGACGCDKEPCPHLEIRDDKYFCIIYTKRDQICAECSEVHGSPISHEGCMRFPDNPWIGVVRDHICAYTFKRVDGGSMDELKFLKGKPYLRA